MLGTGLLLAGWGSGTALANEAAGQEMQAVESTDNAVFKVARVRSDVLPQPYRLAKYDTLSLLVPGHEEDMGIQDIAVDVDGMARLPYCGNVRLAGLTLDEARELIHAALGEYFHIDELNVAIKAYAPRKIYVTGNVGEPGVKELPVDSMNVYAAISNAGGVDKRGRSKHVQLMRQVDGVLYYREINLDAFVKKRDLSQNIQLEDGDIVYVPDSGKVIFGEDVAPYINIWATYRSIVK